MSELRGVTSQVGRTCGAVVDQGLRIIELDEAFARLIGDTRGALLGQPIPDLLPALAAPLRAVLTSGHALPRVLLQRPEDTPLSLRLAPLRTTRGTIAGVELMVEPAGPEAQPPTVRAVLDGLFAFAGVLRPDGTLIEANRAALEVAGLTPGDVLGKPFANTFWWSYDPAVQAQLRAAIARAAGGEIVRYDVPVRFAENQFITIDFMLAPARDVEGRVAYLIPSATDISERIASERTLRERERHLSLALEAAQMGTWEIDLQSHAVLRSPTTDRAFGLTPDGAPRTTDDYFQCVHPEDVGRVAESIRRTVEEGAEHAVEYRVTRPDVAMRWFASRGALIHDDQGTPRRLIGALLDITARKEAEAAIEASEARFQATFEHAPLGIAHVSLAGCWLRVNERLCTITGYTQDELCARTFQSITHPDDLAANLTLVEQLRAGRIDVYDMEKRCIHKDGGAVWVNLTVSLVRRPDGAPDYFIAMVEEISRRKAVEAELHFQAQLLDTVGQGVIATDVDGTVRYWNRFAEQLYGWTREEALGRNILDLVAADITFQQGQAIMAQLQAGEPWAGQYVVRRRDGATFPAFVTDTSLYGSDGAVIGVVGISTDISEPLRLEAEREEFLAREQAARAAAERATARLSQLQAMTAALAEALTPTQVAEVIVEQSLAALGAAASSLRLISADGQTLDALHNSGMPAETAGRWAQIPINTPMPICEVARTGRPLYFDDRDALATRYPAMEQIVAPLGYRAFAIVPLSIEGRTIGSLALTFVEPRHFANEDRDVLLAMTGQAAQAITRAQLYNMAREAVEVRDTFIAIASHDLRSPLTVILGQAQLLERQVGVVGREDQSKQRVRCIVTQTQRLSRMIGTLFDLSRIQSGQLTIDRVPLDFAALADRVVAEIQPTLSQPILEFVGIPEGLWVAGDEIRLEQVLYNLIGNAVKYSPGSCVVTIRVERQDTRAYLAVIDQGIGIPTAALPRLFERYYRAENAGASSGMGIGLYVVREIVTLHGGTVAVVSEAGVGSTFTVDLPLVAEDRE